MWATPWGLGCLQQVGRAECAETGERSHRDKTTVCPFSQKFSGQLGRPANTVLKKVNNSFRKKIDKARGRLDPGVLPLLVEFVSGFQLDSTGRQNLYLFTPETNKTS